jgi:uncharacterized protein YhbP (UPF0306 family)
MQAPESEEMSSGLRSRIEAFLEAHHVMSLATSGPEGPWSAAVFYASDGLTLYFISAPGSRHSRDIEASGRAAATIHRDVGNWREVRGIQLEGEVARIGGIERAAALARYARKFPLIADLSSAPREIAAAMARMEWYRLSPRRVRLVDNTLGFGHREELEL